MTDPTELRRLAEAATPGPWVTEQATLNLVPVYVSSSATCEAVCMMDGGDMPQRHKDAAYIAAMHPETTLALLDRLARAETLVAQCKATLEAMHPSNGVPDWDIARLYNAMMEALGDD